MKVSIVIPVYNEAAYLAPCLKALQAQTSKPYEVIVVDNNSTDSTTSIAEKFSSVKLLFAKKQGTVHARNKGFNFAKGDIIARIDADTLVPPEWVEQIKQLFNSQAHIAAVTGRAHFYDVALPSFFGYIQVLLYQRVQRLMTGTYFLWGANMAVRKSSWEIVRDSCSSRTDVDEDIDLSFCLHESNQRVHYSPELFVRASLQRKKYSLAQSIRYLSSWPRDYVLHRNYAGAVIVTIFSIIIITLTLPITMIYAVKTRLVD